MATHQLHLADRNVLVAPNADKVFVPKTAAYRRAPIPKICPKIHGKTKTLAGSKKKPATPGGDQQHGGLFSCFSERDIPRTELAGEGNHGTRSVLWPGS